MTRMLVVGNMYPPHHLGGYELSCRDVVSRWMDNGHDVRVLTSTFRRDSASDGFEPHVRRALRLYWNDHELVSPSPLGRVLVELANQRALHRALAWSRPDVVSVWNMGAASLGLLTTLRDSRIPTVLNVCDDWLLYGPRLDAWTRAIAGRRPSVATAARRLGVPAAPPTLDWVAATCFVSRHTRDRALEHASWDLARHTVVFSGIERRDVATDASALGDHTWQWRLLFVGRLDPRKGAATVVRALAHLPEEATLEILGPGSTAERDAIQLEARRVGAESRVTFDEVARDELAARYHRADVVVFPSEWDEPFGLVPLEAMAAGTPVVATGVGGSADFLHDGVNCLRFEPRDDASLATALQRLAADPELRRRLVAAGRPLADELTTDRLADVLEAWHVGAADGFAGGVPADRVLPLPMVTA